MTEMNKAKCYTSSLMPRFAECVDASIADSALCALNCSRYVIFPGFCDVHVHFREPGFSYKETIATGSLASAHGGYTAVCTMPNLNPVPDSVEHLNVQRDIIRDTACIHVYPYGAITVGDLITNLPVLDESKCVGCGVCLTKCPGLAIFVVDKSKDMATVSFPFEYLPLPEKGDIVKAVDRAGQYVCDAKVVRINNAKANDCTPIVTIEVPKEVSDDVRSMRRLNLTDEDTRAKLLERDDWTNVPDDLIVCRCEEVTVGDIKKAIAEGAKTVEGIKKRTRAGMGLCQGRTCSKLVSRILGSELGIKPNEIEPDRVRMPIKPVAFGVYKE